MKSLSDGYKFFIPGRPYTKKNSGRYVGKGRFLPSKQYETYRDMAIPVLTAQKRNLKLIEAIGYPVRVTVFYTMENRSAWPDLVGLMQATADLLEETGILENDRFIVSWGNSHVGAVDKEHAGAEILIEKWNPEWGFDPYELDPKLARRKNNG